MAQGIKLPIRPVNGRIPLLTGDAYIQQVVMTGLLGSESSNPFQEGGLGESMIFGINDGMTEAEIRSAIVRMFESLKDDQLAQIDNPVKDIVFRQEDHDLYCDLAYRNIETQERIEMSVPIPEGA